MSESEIKSLTQVVKALRHPETGCPWDLEQTHESLLKFLLEESYEFIAACEESDFEGMKDELGDVLLQVLLHSEIASEKNHFTLEDVAKNLKEKLIRRHPHVFDRPDASISTEEVIANWDEIKASEKQDNGTQKQSHLKPSLINHPALYSAYKIGQKTHKIKFDWEDAMQVSYKVEEEWQELKEEMAPLLSQGSHPTFSEVNREKMEEEMGDFLFSVAQLARHLDLDPETCLRKANKKFLNRFHKMEKMIIEDKGGLEGLNQDQMDVYWNRVKDRES